MENHGAEVRAMLARCVAAGLVVEAIRGQLHVKPAALLTDQIKAELAAHKAELLRLLFPHVNDQGDLVVPFTAPARFHYWNGGQSIAETLGEISAPHLDPETFARHTQPDVSGLVEPMEAMRARWQSLHDGTFKAPANPIKGNKKK